MLLAAAVLVFSVASVASDDDDLKPLGPADVVRVMSSRRTQIRKLCYEQAKPKAEASMRVDFTIAKSGHVTYAKANELKGAQAAADCVVAEVKKTIFPESEGGGSFHWPFIFKGP